MPNDNSYTIVLDASALLASLLCEPGYEKVDAYLDMHPAISAVNFSEVSAKFQERGKPSQEVATLLNDLKLPVLPFTEEDAHAAGALRPLTRPLGLSFGDRACLALAKKLKLPALTAEARWAEIDTGVEVMVIRG